MPIFFNETESSHPPVCQLHVQTFFRFNFAQTPSDWALLIWNLVLLISLELGAWDLELISEANTSISIGVYVAALNDKNVR